MAQGGETLQTAVHTTGSRPREETPVGKLEPFLTIPELAEILRCSEDEARRLCKIGRELGGIQAIKHGKRWLISPKALEEWAERHEYVPAVQHRGAPNGPDYSRSVYTPPKSPHAYWRPKER